MSEAPSKPMRLFTGIAIPTEAAEPLQKLARTIRERLPALQKDLRWSPLEKLHITTKFIGDWPQDRLPELVATLQTLVQPDHASQRGPLPIHMHRLGWMPNPRHPVALYAGVEPILELAQLNAATEAALESLGLPKEDRIYRPHVTLARLRGHNKADLAALRTELVRHELLDFGSFLATSFHLYFSDNGKYTKLNEFPFPSA